MSGTRGKSRAEKWQCCGTCKAVCGCWYARCDRWARSDNWRVHLSDKLRNVVGAVPWPRLLIEGGVIVFSILLAFAIDAWWDDRQERDRELQQLARVNAELRLNQQSFINKLNTLQSAFDSAVSQQALMGDSPQPVDAEALARLWDQILGIGTFSVPSRAIDEYLAAAAESDPEFAVIRDQLTEWLYRTERVSNQYDILRQKHSALTEHLLSIPELRVLGYLPNWMKAAGLPESRFPSDITVLLSDPIVENLLGDYMLRVVVLTSMLEQQIESLDKLADLIDSATVL